MRSPNRIARLGVIAVAGVFGTSFGATASAQSDNAPADTSPSGEASSLERPEAAPGVAEQEPTKNPDSEAPAKKGAEAETDAASASATGSMQEAPSTGTSSDAAGDSTKAGSVGMKKTETGSADSGEAAGSGSASDSTPDSTTDSTTEAAADAGAVGEVLATGAQDGQGAVQPAKGHGATIEGVARVSAEVSKGAASGPIERNGFYFGIGLGIGGSGLADDSLFGTPFAGTANLRMGGVIRDRYLVGVQASVLGQYHAWEAQKPFAAALSALLLEASVFPMADVPLSLSAGTGWGSAVKIIRLANSRKDNPKVVAATGDGVAWMGAVGWDFFAGIGTNVGLQMRYEGTQSSDLGAVHGGMLNFWLNFY